MGLLKHYTRSLFYPFSKKKSRLLPYFFSLLFLLLSSNTSLARTDKYRCMWREDPATTMVIAWNQVSGSDPVLYFDQSDGGLEASHYAYSQKPTHFTNFKGMNNSFVRLSGLQPGTVYHFIIVDSDSVSKRFSFRTAPDHPYERISIIAGGDSRNYRDARRRANKLVAKLQPHCVLFGGDMTGGDSAKEWIEWFDDWQHTINDDGRMIPVLATRGNHEYSNKTIVELFDVPSKDVYYNMSIGGSLLQIYTLNSLIAAGGNQRFWLQNELQQSRHTWKMAQYHFGTRPHHDRKSERNTQLYNWAPLFYDYEVNLVVESDAHVVKTTWPIRPSKEKGSDEGFIRDDQNGTVYVGEGCWGAPLRRNNDDKLWTRNSGSFNQFKWIFVDEEKMEIRTIKTDNADEVAAVSSYDIFTPPAGLDIWAPSNGAVLTIPARHNQNSFPLMASTTASVNPKNWTASSKQMIANTSPSPKPAVKAKVVKTEVELKEFKADYQEAQASLQWNTQEAQAGQLVYELQRAVDGLNFQTIAEISARGSGGGAYNIADPSYAELKNEALSYRLKYVAQGQTYIFDAPKAVLPKPNPWRAFPELLPNYESSQLKVKYELKENGPVSIQLVNELENTVSLQEYPEQHQGKYLRTINMAIFPKGLYLLIIKINEDQVNQYQVVWK